MCNNHYLFSSVYFLTILFLPFQKSQRSEQENGTEEQSSPRPTSPTSPPPNNEEGTSFAMDLTKDNIID